MKLHVTILLLCCVIACADKKLPAKTSPHYDLNNPEKFILPNMLYEISGIAFGSNDDTIYAEQDEEGTLFHFSFGNKDIKLARFGKKGDYEDVAICHNTVIMLRSDGTLYTFPLAEANDKRITDVKEWGGLLPAGEYEGLCADQSANKLYVLCKHCTEEKTSKRGGGTILTIDSTGAIAPSGSFGIHVKEIEALAGENKISFHPSALAKNAAGEWYILSSVNKMLVIADANWQVKEVYPLNPSIFVQPEGIAFDSKNNLYISNEGGTTSGGNVLKFTYKP